MKRMGKVRLTTFTSLAIMCFFAAFFGYAQRYGLALAIVRMQAALCSAR